MGCRAEVVRSSGLAASHWLGRRHLGSPEVDFGRIGAEVGARVLVVPKQGADRWLGGTVSGRRGRQDVQLPGVRRLVARGDLQGARLRRGLLGPVVAR